MVQASMALVLACLEILIFAAHLLLNKIIKS